MKRKADQFEIFATKTPVDRDALNLFVIKGYPAASSCPLPIALGKDPVVRPNISRFPKILSQTTVVLLVPVSIAAILLQRTPQTTTALVKVLAVFVADLSARLAASVLAALFEARVQVGADDAFVELRAANVLHTVKGVLVGKVFDKAEAAGGLVEAVQAHDQALDLAALAEELVDLLLGGEEGEVADVEGGGVCQRVLGGLLGFVVGRFTVVLVIVASVAVMAAAFVELQG